MKIPAGLLCVLAGWLAVTRVSNLLPSPPSEQTWMLVTATLALSFLVSLAAIFVRAGRIRLEENQLVISTPLGFAKIPYSEIETIRRCRRGGVDRQQRLQIIFRSHEDQKILQIRPGNISEFTKQLRRKCPHLSSSSDQTLVRQAGQARLLHSM